MNREIKFRAWIIEEKKMLENGDWFMLDVTYPTPMIQYADQGYYVNNKNASGEHLKSLQKNNIEPKDDFVLMQYTGLHDKNSKEIYEGDILKYIDGSVGFVRFDYGWAIEYSKEYSHDMPPLYCERLEVIGNIYENSELLKK